MKEIFRYLRNWRKKSPYSEDDNFLRSLITRKLGRKFRWFLMMVEVVVASRESSCVMNREEFLTFVADYYREELVKV